MLVKYLACNRVYVFLYRLLFRRDIFCNHGAFILTEWPRISANRVMLLPRKEWKNVIINTVDPHLHDMVRLHIRNALERIKWQNIGRRLG